MSLRVVFRQPGTLNFDTFATSTRKLVELLAPLAPLGESKSKVGRALSVQVVRFMIAIQQGAKAAKCGYTAAEDIVAFVTAPEDVGTATDRNDYFVGTLKFADEAYTEAQNAYTACSNVRKTIFRIADKFNTIHSKNASELDPVLQTPDLLDAVIKFRNDTNALENFAAQASSLAQWWEWIQVETNLLPKKLKTGSRVLTFDDSSLKEPGVLEKWQTLRTQFSQYTNMVDQLEDRHPTLFAMAKTTSSKKSKLPLRKDIRRALWIAAQPTPPLLKSAKPTSKSANATSHPKEKIIAASPRST